MNLEEMMNTNDGWHTSTGEELNDMLVTKLDSAVVNMVPIPDGPDDMGDPDLKEMTVFILEANTHRSSEPIKLMFQYEAVVALKHVVDGFLSQADAPTQVDKDVTDMADRVIRLMREMFEGLADDDEA